MPLALDLPFFFCCSSGRFSLPFRLFLCASESLTMLFPPMSLKNYYTRNICRYIQFRYFYLDFIHSQYNNKSQYYHIRNMANYSACPSSAYVLHRSVLFYELIKNSTLSIEGLFLIIVEYILCDTMER